MDWKRLAFVVLAVGLTAVGAYLLLHGGASDPASETLERGATPAASPPPALRGTGEDVERPHEAEPVAAPLGEAAAGEEPRTIQGRVVDASGRPVEGARIYLVPKGEPGLGMAYSLAVPLAWTGADGRWSLAGGSVAGYWIGAHAGEFVRPVVLDGDALAPGDVELRLPGSALLRVTTSYGDGELPEGASFNLHCRPPGDLETWPFPAPDTPFFFDVRWPLGEVGITSIPLPSGSPVEVHLEALSFYAEPERIVVDGLPTSVHFDLYPLCWLSVRILDEAGAKPLRTNVGIAVGDPDTPVGTVGWTQMGAWPTQDGFVEIFPGHRPGTHAVHVTAAGYRDVETEVTFHEPGESKTIDVRLEKALDVGILRLELVHEETVGAETAFVAAVRPAGGGPWRSKPAAGRTGLGEGVTRIDIESMPEGVYDVMVWMRPTTRVGYAMSVAVHGGVATEQTVRLDEGLLVELEEDRKGDVYVRLEAEPLGRLPLITFWGTSYTNSDERVGKHAPALGPYPFEGIERVTSSRPFGGR